MRLCASFCAVIALLLSAAVYPYREHLATSLKAMRVLATMPDEDIDNFFKGYEVLETMGTDGRVGVKDEKDAKAIHDIYKVLNQVLAVGVVMEIMLMPPTMDRRATVLENIYLWEKRMIKHLELKPGGRVLDVGSGRGKIAIDVAKATGAGVVQVNIDETQLALASEFAQSAGVLDKMEFRNQDFNLPYPYLPNASIDAQYCAQACAFIHDRVKHLKEMYRVLKPGAIVYQLEWLAKDFGDRPGLTAASGRGAYDKNNATHRELVRRCGVLVAGALPAGVLEWESAFREAGFELLKSQDPGEAGTLVVLDRTNKAYEPLSDAIIWLARHGLVPKRFGDLFVRLRTYWESAVEAYKMDLVSLSWEFVARKPLDA